MALFLTVFFSVQCIHWIGFLVDDLIFRNYRKVAVKKPLFIVGIPRSGTTFLHQVLAKDTEQFTTLKLWELILAPSITERVVWTSLGKLDRLVGHPFDRLIRLVERKAFGRLETIHRISFSAPEEDYFLLVPLFACFLLVLPFPWSQELWQLAYFDDQISAAKKKEIMRFYRQCLQRHLYFHGPHKSILSKNPAFSPMIKSLKETFPDCRFICMMRNPLNAIPSHLSSMMAGAQLFNNHNETDYQKRLVDLMKHFYHYVAAQLPALPKDRRCFILLGELKDDVHKWVHLVYNRLGFDLSASFNHVLLEEAQRSRRYESNHAYSLEQFGLQEETMVNEFSSIFEQFDNLTTHST